MSLSISLTLVNLLPLSNCPVLSSCEYVSPVSHLTDTCPARSNGRTLVGVLDIQIFSARSCCTFVSHQGNILPCRVTHSFQAAQDQSGGQDSKVPLAHSAYPAAEIPILIRRGQQFSLRDPLSFPNALSPSFEKEGRTYGWNTSQLGSCFSGVGGARQPSTHSACTAEGWGLWRSVGPRIRIASPGPGSDDPLFGRLYDPP